MDAGENEDEEEDIEENNEGTAPDEGAQVIVDLRNNRGGAPTYNGAVRIYTLLLQLTFNDLLGCVELQDSGWNRIKDGLRKARNLDVELEDNG